MPLSTSEGAFQHRLRQHVRVASKLPRLLLAICAFVLVLGLGELLLRALPAGGQGGDPGLRALHRPEPDRPWLYGARPGARTTLAISGDVVYEINDDGFRGPRAPLDRIPGTLRILVIGDSLAFGYGVAEDQTFARRLEALLGERRPTEVINLGICGYNPYNENALLAGRGIEYQPDIVLVQFCVNDLNDPTLHFDTQTRGGLGEIPLEAIPSGVRVIDANPCGRWEICRRLRAVMAPSDRRQALLAMTSLDLEPGPRREWLGALYRAMADTAHAHSAKLAVVGFPFPAQVSDGRMLQLQSQLAQLASESEFGWIDLLPAFAAAEKGGGAPLFIDLYHPSARGHEIAARAIAASLDAAGWIEE